MRAKDWLEVVSGEDARMQSFRLTAQGKCLLARAVPAWEVAQRQAAHVLGAEGDAMLNRVDRTLRMRHGSA